jgi:hypothetical protein
MFSHTNKYQISYLGVPGAYRNVDFKISTFDDFFLLMYDVARYNLSIGTNLVCLNVCTLNLDKSFFTCILDENDEQTSIKINKLKDLVKKDSVKFSFFLEKEYFLGSQIEVVVHKSFQLIKQISSILDSIGIICPSIILRVGSAYGNRKSTMQNFCERLEQLDASTVSKICVCNDDKPSLFSVTDLLSGIYYEKKIPICFRALAHHFNDGGLSLREALFLSCSTWKDGSKPIFIYSESSENDKFGFPVTPIPSKNLTTRIPTFGLDCDIFIDSPDGESCLVSYFKTLRSLPPLVINKVNKK